MLGSALYGQSADTGCVGSENCTDITGNITFKFGTTAGSDVDYDSTSNTVSFGKDITEVTLKDTEFQNDKFNFPNSTMTIDFGDRRDDTQRKFTLEATNDFKGNLTVLAGKGAPSGGDTQNSSFVGTFNQGFEGNITLGYNATTGGNAAGHTNTLTFSSGSLTGNLNATAGTNTITFANGGIEGNITAGAAYGSFAKAANNITFKGDNASIKGKITAQPGEYTGGSGTNTITFEKGGSIALKDEKNSSQDAVILSIGSLNTIVFGSSTQNEATIQNNSTKNSITGNIVAHASSGGGTGKNAITFKNGGTNTITGDIIATNRGVNNIMMNGTNTINGSIKAGTNGYPAYNNLYFSGTSTTIGSNGSMASLIANQDDGNRTDKINLLLFTSNTNTLNFTSIEAKNPNPVVSGNPVSKNIISLDDTVTKTASTSNVTIKTMTANSAYNYIGKGILTSANAITDASSLNLEDNTASMSFIDDTNAFTGNLSIGSMTSIRGGINNIAFKASNTILTQSEEKSTSTQNAIIGSIALNTNETTLASNYLATAISGNNNLYLDLSANTDFANVSNLVSGISSTTSSQDLLAKTQAVILGNIDNESGRTNNIKVVGSSSNIKIGLVGNITTNGGTNNLIFENSIWLPSYTTNSSSSGTTASLPENLSGTLINNGGTTNIVLRTSSATLNSLGASMFNVTNAATNGKTNIVVQGQVNIGANITYGGKFETVDNQEQYVWDGRNHLGQVTFIFANSNDGGESVPTPLDNSSSTRDSFVSNQTDTTNNKVLGVTYQDGIKLALKDTVVKINGKNTSFLQAYKDYFTNVADNGLLTLVTNRSNSSNTQTDTITIKGLALGNISELASSATEAAKTATTTYNYNVTIDKDSAFVGNISLQENSNVTLTMKEGSKLLTDSEYLKINSLTIENTKGVSIGEVLANTFAQSNTIVDIASMGNDLGDIATRSKFRLLEIGSADTVASSATTGASTSNGLQGTGALFRVYMNAGADQGSSDSGGATLGGSNNESKAGSGTYGYTYSDRILVLSGSNSDSSGSNTTKVNYIQALADSSTQLENIKYNGGGTETAGNIAVATVKGTNGSQVATFEGAAQIQGFDVVGTTLTAVATDQYGKVQSQQNLLTDANSYTTYFIGSMTSQGASLANQQVSASALGANYDLYLANLNSLNKRMGELRENANSQGAWVRVFNGMQTSKFALETKSIYTTIQAGYDYAFGFNGANNYLGFAISYANSISDSKTMSDIDASNKGIKNINSNAVEFAIYNAYVQDGASKESGWKNGLYTDSILKFSYITSKLDLTGETKTYSTNNYAITFSQEVGYRFLLGKAKEFYIDPQAEISLGYLNQSDLKQELGQSFLNGIQDSIFTLRGRIGSNFGYDFKNFTQDKGFNAKIYLGTYFVGDYISGGDVSLTSNLGSKVSLSPLASTTRFVLNLGTNFKIKDAHRIYFDFERSFGGKIITDYQINLGYRYSFGASNHTPYNGISTTKVEEAVMIKEVAPTKGFYLEIFEKQELSKKESKLLKDLKDLKVKTNNNTKTYLVGPFNDERDALKQKEQMQGILKELNSNANMVAVE